MNFGNLFDNLIRITPELMKDKKGSNVIKECVACLTNSKPMQKEYKFYDIVRNGTSNKEALKMMVYTVSESDKKAIREGNKKFQDLLNGYNLLEEKNELYDALETLLTEDFNVNKLEKFADCHTLLEEKVKILDKEEINEDKTTIPIDTLCRYMVHKYNRKYEEALNESEKALVKRIVSAKTEDAKKALFTEQKKDCLSVINEELVKESTNAKDSDSLEYKSKLLTLKEKIIDESFDEKNYYSNIIDYIDIVQTINN